MTTQINPDQLLRLIGKRSFATLATTSPQGRPHVAGVLYDLVDRDLWVSTDLASRKGRNLAANGKVAVMIPVRRLPVGPPSSIQFQSTGQLVPLDDPWLGELAAAGKLPTVTGHGELERPGGCFVRIGLPDRLLTFGLGMSLFQLLRNPLDAAGFALLAPRVTGPAVSAA
ncbi:MAG TPA: pyridoxamine 5'-phosphate oxidase family protein [Natronosporangium sp.]